MEGNPGILIEAVVNFVPWVWDPFSVVFTCHSLCTVHFFNNDKMLMIANNTGEKNKMLHYFTEAISGSNCIKH